MPFEPDFIISWDISKKDTPIIAITKIEYDPKVKNLVGHVIETINAGSGGAISLNQVIARHNMQNLIEKLEAKDNETEGK